MASDPIRATRICISPWVELIKLVAVGTMGEVWRGHHRGLDLPVAIKLLSSELVSEPKVRERFVREARAAAKIESDHVVRYYDYGETDNGRPFIVMEWLTGVTLQEVLDEQGALAPRKVSYIIDHLAKALSVVHEAGVVHRDVKPDNVLLVPQGKRLVTKLVDFSVSTYAVAKSIRLTQPGTLVGTPSYMCREQVLYGRCDRTGDLWSLAVVAYELLTGELPFQGDTVGAVCASIVDGEYLPPSQRLPALGEAVDAWFAKAVSVNPEDRFGSASELAESFSRAIRQAFGKDALPRLTPPGDPIPEPRTDAPSTPPSTVTLDPVTEEHTPEPRRSWPWVMLASALVSMAIGTAWYVGLIPIHRTLPAMAARELTLGASALATDNIVSAWMDAQPWQEYAMRYEASYFECRSTLEESQRLIDEEAAKAAAKPKPWPVKKPAPAVPTLAVDSTTTHDNF